MLRAAYFRFQADRCLRLANKAKDMSVAAELIRMAEEFSERADELNAWEEKPLAHGPQPRQT